MKLNLLSITLSLLLLSGAGSWLVISCAGDLLGSSGALGDSGGEPGESAPRFAQIQAILASEGSQPQPAATEVETRIKGLESSGLAAAAQRYEALAGDLQSQLPGDSPLRATQTRSYELSELQAPAEDLNRLATKFRAPDPQRLQGLLKGQAEQATDELKRGVRQVDTALEKALNSASQHVGSALESARRQLVEAAGNRPR